MFYKTKKWKKIKKWRMELKKNWFGKELKNKSIKKFISKNYKKIKLKIKLN